MMVSNVYQPKEAPVHSCRYSRDGSRLAVINIQKGTIVILQCGENTSPICHLNTGSDITCLNLSWDGSWVAHGDSFGRVGIRGPIPAVEYTFSEECHAGSVTDIGFNWSGLLCASCDAKGEVFVHTGDGHTFSSRSIYKHTGPLRALCFTCDEQAVYCGDSEGYLLRISLSRKEILWKKRLHSGAVTCISPAPDGKRIATGGDDATVRIWDVDPDSSTFGQCLQILEVKMNCQGMQISGARGLGAEMLRFFKDRGAVLDEE